MSRSPSRDRSGSRAAGRTNGATSGGGGSSDTGPAPIISSVAGSGEANGSNAITMSVDGNDGNRWLSNTTTGTLTFTLTTTAVCTGYRITPPWGGLTNTPKTWTFQGSPDNSVWTTLDTQTNVTTWLSAQNRNFAIANTTSYLYYRIVITAANGGANVGLGEIRLTLGTGLAALGSNGGSMVEWWDASTITGKTDGATIAAADLVDQSATHNFSSVAGTITYRATGGPNSKPCLESLSTGSALDIAGVRAVPAGDCTMFAVVNLLNTTTQQIFGGGTAGSAIDVNAGKFRMMKLGTAQLAVSTTSHPTTTWCLVIVTYVSSTGATKFRIIQSGSDVTDTVAGSAGTFTDNLTHTGWGTFDGTTNAALRGSCAEMGRYSEALDLTTGDGATLVSTLKTKYGF